jgi:GTPase
MISSRAKVPDGLSSSNLRGVKFIDEAKITVKAGDGGDGAVAFGIGRSGPTGGDGGDGGSVIVVSDGHLASLLDYKYRRNYTAGSGEPGRNKDQYGAAAGDLTLKVPVGTVIYEEGVDEPLADLSNDGDSFVVAKGGIGGRGNMHFATPWNQAPKKAEPGTPGEQRVIRLELKLLADVGLLGFPNVGKSTFISHVSRARPKIADYPFTTLSPNLGVVKLSDERIFVIADIPGLIEGAAEGAGLGHQFLRHVERCRVLLHIVEATFTVGPDRTPIRDFEIINGELGRYAPELAKTPQVVVLNKVDATDEALIAEQKKAFADVGVELLTMSAATGEGISAVLEALWVHVRRA